MGISTLGISELPLGNLKRKWHLGVGLMAKHKVYYKGEGGGFPQVRVVMSLVSPCLPVVRPCTKMFQLRTNQLVVWFCAGSCEWLNCLSIFLVPIPELQHAPLPPKCYELRSTPQLFLLSLFSPLDL
jgi:hypothetical protein